TRKASDFAPIVPECRGTFDSLSFIIRFWVRLFTQRKLKHTGVANGDHCIVQFRSASCYSLSVDPRTLL
ncbi:MAG TPA: hypothetical protein VN648_12250, partial [Candidatus Methylomirabilis sp.]|nr:hypothetical protein [Candidatus Methylomirabilis sp.]